MPQIDAEALSKRPIIPYAGHVYRTIARRYPADNFEGYLRAAGRLNEIGDGPIGYFSTSEVTSLAEVIRHIHVRHALADITALEEMPSVVDQYLDGYLNTRRIVEFEVLLVDVLDVRDLAAVGIKPEEFFQTPPGGWDAGGFISQQLGREVRRRGHEALLVPSASGLGDNLIVFPGNLHPGSMLKPGPHRDPSLYTRGQR